MTFDIETGGTNPFLRMALFGGPGSGKTWTAALVASSLADELCHGRPVFWIETEEDGVDWVRPIFREVGVPLGVEKTRDFSRVLSLFDEAEKSSCAVLVIDSVSHFWRSLQSDFLDAHPGRGGQLQFQDWGPIKKNWGRIASRVVTYKGHVIVCSRQSGVYELEKRGGKLEPVYTGERPEAEKGFAYEFSLLVRMALVEERKGEILTLVNRATVLRDRSATIQGKIFSAPKYEDFRPFIARLAAGSGYRPLPVTAPPDPVQVKQRKRKLACDLQEIFLSAGIGGDSPEAVGRRRIILLSTFGTSSGAEAWSKLDEQLLRDCVARIRKELLGGRASPEYPPAEVEASAPVEVEVPDPAEGEAPELTQVEEPEPAQGEVPQPAQGEVYRGWYQGSSDTNVQEELALDGDDQEELYGDDDTPF